MMMNISNFLSLLRGPLALVFLGDNILLKVTAIILAMLTDIFDGYFARRTNTITKVGTVLDPLMDKIFVAFVLAVFLWEGTINWWETLALISRDFAIFFFGLFLLLKGSWHRFEFQSIWSGKLTTTLQFFTMIALTLRIPIPYYVYTIFIILSAIFWGQLYLIDEMITTAPREPK